MDNRMSLQMNELGQFDPVGTQSVLAVMELQRIRKHEQSGMQPILEINERDFEAEVLKSGQPVLVNFWAAWSQPCRRLADVLDEVGNECNGKAKIVKVNVDDNPHLGMCYGIQFIPALLCFVNGEVSARIVGTASKEAILSRLKLLTEAAPSNPEPSGQAAKPKT
jgi:thioredoxin 1